MKQFFLLFAVACFLVVSVPASSVTPAFAGKRAGTTTGKKGLAVTGCGTAPVFSLALLLLFSPKSAAKLYKDKRRKGESMSACKARRAKSRAGKVTVKPKPKDKK